MDMHAHTSICTLQSLSISGDVHLFEVQWIVHIDGGPGHTIVRRVLQHNAFIEASLWVTQLHMAGGHPIVAPNTQYKHELAVWNKEENLHTLLLIL